MKKTLEIEMEEECLICPNLSLTTTTFYAEGEVFFKSHDCEHLEFCKKVRRAWETVQEKGGRKG